MRADKVDAIHSDFVLFAERADGFAKQFSKLHIELRHGTWRGPGLAEHL